MNFDSSKFGSIAALSNLGSFVNVIAAPIYLEPVFAIPMMIVAFLLGVFSGGFHAIRNLFWQKLDVWAVMLQIFGVAGVAAGKIGPDALAYTIPLTLGAVYHPIRYEINLPRHVYVSVACTSVLLYFAMGWWVLVPLGFFALGGVGKLIEWMRDDVNAHGHVHAWLWHQSVFASVLSVIVLI